MHTLGIDLSTDPRKTWTCEIDWSVDPPRVVALECLSEVPDSRAPRPSDPWRSPTLVRNEAGLIATLANRITAFAPASDRIVGVDAPFGWPTAFVDAIGDWEAGDLRGFVKRPELRLRATDRFVRAATGLSPMSVSTDRIGSTAMLCVEVLSTVARQQDRPRFDLARASDGLAEVYPAAALRMWTGPRGAVIPTAGYKTPGMSDEGGARAQLLRHLIGLHSTYGLLGIRERFGNDYRRRPFDPDQPRTVQHPSFGAAGVLTTATQRDDMIDSDDALDAFVCALVARAIGLGRCFSVDRPALLSEIYPSPKSDPNDPSERTLARAARAVELQVEARSTADAEGWIHVPMPGCVRDGLGVGPVPEVSQDDDWLRRALAALSSGETDGDTPLDGALDVSVGNR